MSPTPDLDDKHLRLPHTYLIRGLWAPGSQLQATGAKGLSSARVCVGTWRLVESGAFLPPGIAFSSAWEIRSPLSSFWLFYFTMEVYACNCFLHHTSCLSKRCQGYTLLTPYSWKHLWELPRRDPAPRAPHQAGNFSQAGGPAPTEEGPHEVYWWGSLGDVARRPPAPHSLWGQVGRRHPFQEQGGPRPAFALRLPGPARPLRPGPL